MMTRSCSFLCLTLLMCCTVAAVAQATEPEILHYRDGSSSRQERGQPGRNVTGQWSWMDASGRNHRIWYIADEFGFQAFGDLVPAVGQGEAARAPEEPQGKAVLLGKQLSGHHNPTTPRTSPEEGERQQHSAGTRAAPPAVSQISSPSGGGSVTKPDSNPDDVSVLGLLTNRDNSRQQATEPLPQSQVVKNSNILSEETNRSRGSTKFMRSDRTSVSASLSKNPSSEIVINSNSMTINNQESESKTQAITDSKTPKIAKMISGDLAGNNQDLFHSELPNPISGTKFVLIDRLQPPTIPKARVIPSPIRPRPVTNKGPVAVISGVHTSSRSKSLAKDFIERTTALGSHLTRGKAEERESIVPQPLKVEGNLNLENFFSPINLAKTTPAPFELGSLDDYYYDYDYYDYPASELGANSTSSNISVTNTTSPASITPSKIPLGEPSQSPQLIALTTPRASTSPEVVSPSILEPTPATTVQVSTPSSLLSESSIDQSRDRDINSDFVGLSKQSPSASLPSFPPQLSKPKPSSSSHRNPSQLSLSLPASPPPRLGLPVSRPHRRPFSRMTSSSVEHKSDEDDCNDSDDSLEGGGEQDD